MTYEDFANWMAIVIGGLLVWVFIKVRKAYRNDPDTDLDSTFKDQDDK